MLLLFACISTNSTSVGLDWIWHSGESSGTNLSQRIDTFFRKLCDKLYLKAETQQVDRILEQFSRRYWDNNPSSVFGSAGELNASIVTFFS